MPLSIPLKGDTRFSLTVTARRRSFCDWHWRCLGTNKPAIGSLPRVRLDLAYAPMSRVSLYTKTHFVLLNVSGMLIPYTRLACASPVPGINLPQNARNPVRKACRSFLYCRWSLPLGGSRGLLCCLRWRIRNLDVFEVVLADCLNSVHVCLESAFSSTTPESAPRLLRTYRLPQRGQTLLDPSLYSEPSRVAALGAGLRTGPFGGCSSWSGHTYCAQISVND